MSGWWTSRSVPATMGTGSPSGAMKQYRTTKHLRYDINNSINTLINFLLFQVSADQNLSISSNNKHCTSSVQNLPTSKLSRDRSNSDNGEFRESENYK